MPQLEEKSIGAVVSEVGFICNHLLFESYSKTVGIEKHELIMHNPLEAQIFALSVVC
jgi:hypothetical protein